jgi:hypothetical protein
MTNVALGLRRSEEAQDVAEYAVMLAVILVVVIGTIRLEAPTQTLCSPTSLVRSNSPREHITRALPGFPKAREGMGAEPLLVSGAGAVASEQIMSSVSAV